MKTIALSEEGDLSLELKLFEIVSFKTILIMFYELPATRTCPKVFDANFLYSRLCSYLMLIAYIHGCKIWFVVFLGKLK